MEKQLLLTGTLNTLLPAVFSAKSAASITYKLVMLMIKRRSFSQNRS